MSNRLSRRTKFLYGIGDTGFSSINPCHSLSYAEH